MGLLIAERGKRSMPNEREFSMRRLMNPSEVTKSPKHPIPRPHEDRPPWPQDETREWYKDLAQRIVVDPHWRDSKIVSQEGEWVTFEHRTANATLKLRCDILFD